MFTNIMSNIFLLPIVSLFPIIHIRFISRELVCKNKPLYDKYHCKEYRLSLATEIVNTLLPGRFIRIEGGAQYGCVLDHSKSVTKVSHFLFVFGFLEQSE